ncbi:MAG: class I SAM-dependent methyltransferase [Chloroflexota bacterium]
MIGRSATLAAPPTGRLVAAKRSYYRRPEVAAEYDARRFGGASGGYVNRREIALAAKLVPDGAAVIADVGTGTGRLLSALGARGRTVIGLDASLPMLRQAARTRAGGLVQADAFRLPVLDASCDAVVSLRLLFHFDDVEPLLREARRIARTGGVLVCDTCSWSPRGWLPLDRGHWGERVATISRERFRHLALNAGWQVEEEQACFLVSPYVYRRLPLPVARWLERMERRLPPALLCRGFWALRATTPDFGRAAGAGT